MLEAGIEQQVLVDLVSGDVARRSPVHLGLSRQVHLQHLQEHKQLNSSKHRRLANTENKHKHFLPQIGGLLHFATFKF